MNAEAVNLQGLWKYYGNVFDGSQKRFDNINISIEGDYVHFYINKTQAAKGFLKNDTIFVEQGYEFYYVDWIRIVNKDSLISSLSANNSIPTFSFSRLDLNGEWEQTNYGRIILPAADVADVADGAVRAVVGIDTCTIVQEKDSVYFYDSSDLLAKGYLIMDSLILVTGFDGIGIDYFTVLSNDSFYKNSPLIEAIDEVVFSRINNVVGIKELKNNLLKPVVINLTNNQLSVVSENKQIKNVRIYTMQGKIIKTKLVGKNSLGLNISDLVHGMYVLEIQFNDQKKIRHSFVIK
ncbi:MAG TPA: T9SS type A sorting domain-containing protein [Treponemataceae bacterium]|nr:T9SS type A sorting domain-containing protein [Treponemataceae bacterium]